MTQNTRPTNQRISQLEQENAALRQQRFYLQNEQLVVSRDISPLAGQCTIEVAIDARPRPSPNDGYASSSRIGSHPEVPDSGSSRDYGKLYHGPTSTVYRDIASLDEGEDTENPRLSVTNDQWTRHLLFAQTAKQSE